MQRPTALRRARALAACAALLLPLPLLAQGEPVVPVSVAIHGTTNVFVSFRLPAGAEIAGDSLSARLDPDGPDLALLGPAPSGTNELGAPAWTAPFIAVFAAPSAVPSNAFLRLRFQLLAGIGLVFEPLLRFLFDLVFDDFVVFDLFIVLLRPNAGGLAHRLHHGIDFLFVGLATLV